MDGRALVRKFQQMKSMSNKRFWQEMNHIHTQAYAKAANHYQEAMEIVLQPKQRKSVTEKAEEIREQWDGLRTVTINDTEGVQFKTAAEIIHNLSATEAYIFNLQSEELIDIGGRTFAIRPVGEEAQHGYIDTES